MISPVIRFPSTRHFKLENTPSSKDFVLLFLDKLFLAKYFGIDEKRDIPPCVSLPLPQTESWGKTKEMVSVLLLSGANASKTIDLIRNYPELKQNTPFYFLTPSYKKNYDIDLETDHLFCCYTLYQGKWYPVSYTPFQSAVIELDIENTYDFIAFGSESNLCVAALEENEIHISPMFGRLTDWNQLEIAHHWMEVHRKDFTTKGVIFHEYYHESLLHSYLSKYGQKSAYTHTTAHFANVLFDNHFSTTPLLGIIFDEEDHTRQGAIEGSDIVYGTMAQVEILASWRPIPIPGNASIYFEPWRITLALLRDIVGNLGDVDIPFVKTLYTNQEIRYVIDAINKRIINITPSASMTHILMAIFELLDYRNLVEDPDTMTKRFDELFLSEDVAPYKVDLIVDNSYTYLDTYALIREILQDLQAGIPSFTILQKAIHSLFLNTTTLVKTFAEKYHEKRVALSGHLFTHPHLLYLMEHYLREEGLEPIIHHHIPTGDSSVALGALLHVLAQKETKLHSEA